MTDRPSRSRIPRRVFASVTALGLAAGLVACGSSDDSSEASDGDTRSVVDATGVTVEVPASPERIVTTHYAATQSLLDLDVVPIGQGPVTENTVPESAWGRIADVPQVAAEDDVHVEKIAELAPDLILVPNTADAGVVDQLDDIAPVYRFSLRGSSRADWQGRVAGIADAIDRTDVFEAERTKFDEELAALGERYRDVVQDRTVAVIGAFEEGTFYAFGEKNMPGTILSPIGFRWSAAEEAAVAGEDEPEATVSTERLADTLADADVLFYNTDARNGTTPLMNTLRETPMYRDLPAVRDGHDFPFGKVTVGGFLDARTSIANITAALDSIGAA